MFFISWLIMNFTVATHACNQVSRPALAHLTCHLFCRRLRQLSECAITLQAVFGSTAPTAARGDTEMKEATVAIACTMLKVGSPFRLKQQHVSRHFWNQESLLQVITC